MVEKYNSLGIVGAVQANQGPSRNGFSVGRRGALRASLRTRATAALPPQITDVQDLKPIYTLCRSDTLAVRARRAAPSRALTRARPEMDSRWVDAAPCTRRSELAPPLRYRRKLLMCRSLSRSMCCIAQTRSLSVLGAPRLLDPQNRKPGWTLTRPASDDRERLPRSSGIPRAPWSGAARPADSAEPPPPQLAPRQPTRKHKAYPRRRRLHQGQAP